MSKRGENHFSKVHYSIIPNKMKTIPPTTSASFEGRHIDDDDHYGDYNDNNNSNNNSKWYKLFILWSGRPRGTPILEPPWSGDWVSSWPKLRKGNATQLPKGNSNNNSCCCSSISTLQKQWNTTHIQWRTQQYLQMTNGNNRDSMLWLSRWVDENWQHFVGDFVAVFAELSLII